jgi:hypothetical protein
MEQEDAFKEIAKEIEEAKAIEEAQIIEKKNALKKAKAQDEKAEEPVTK